MSQTLAVGRPGGRISKFCWQRICVTDNNRKLYPVFFIDQGSEYIEKLELGHIYLERQNYLSDACLPELIKEKTRKLSLINKLFLQEISYKRFIETLVLDSVTCSSGQSIESCEGQMWKRTF